MRLRLPGLPLPLTGIAMTAATPSTRTLTRRAHDRMAAQADACGPQSACCGASGTSEAPKTLIQVYDPAMCCATGVCGPSVDPKLVRFAADLEWLKSQGVAVQRFNLSQQPMAFAQDAEVRAALQEQGEGALPLVKVDGKVQSQAVYPSRDQLAAWAGVAAPAASIYTAAVQELVAIGAAIAANCEPCFRSHYDQARKLGVSREDMLCAVRTGQRVKEAPARSVQALAERYLTQSAAGLLATPEVKLLPAAPETGCAGSSESSDCCG